MQVIDAHQHLVERQGTRYLLEDFLKDTQSIGGIIASVYVQSGQKGYRTSGPAHLKSVGETEFAKAVGDEASTKGLNACAAIVAFAELTNGATLQETLDHHREAGGGRFRGIRYTTLYDEEDDYLTITGLPAKKPAGLLLDKNFQESIRVLGKNGLSYDNALFHHQIPELVVAARQCPDTTIIMNHMGFALGVGRFASRRKEVFEDWKASLKKLSECPNVVVKVGGMGVPLWGFDFHTRATPASSEELAEGWRPYAETCIEIFGPSRCMLESNFPTDRHGVTYKSSWGALSLIASRYSADEQAKLFRETAARVYKIALQG